MFCAIVQVWRPHRLRVAPANRMLASYAVAIQFYQMIEALLLEVFSGHALDGVSVAVGL